MTLRLFVIALAVVTAVLGSLVLLAAPVRAQQGPSTTTTTTPPWYPLYEPPSDYALPTTRSVGSGIDSLLRPPDLQEADAPTLYEQYGTAAFSLDHSLGTFDVRDKTLNAIASIIWAISLMFSSAAMTVFQWAFSLDLWNWFGDAVQQIVDELRGSIFGPISHLALILTAGWLLWQGIVRRSMSQAGEGMIWTILALGVTLAFLTSAQTLVGTATAATTGLSRTILSGTAAADAAPSPSFGVADGASYTGDHADVQIRRAADRFWRANVVAPWETMTCGSVEACEPYADRILAARVNTDRADRSLLEGAVDTTIDLFDFFVPGAERAVDFVFGDRPVTQGQVELLEVADEIKDEGGDTWDWYSGNQATGRIGVALVALVATGLMSFLVLIIAGSLLLAQVVVVILVLMSPLFLAVGIHPGTGRVIALRWLATLINALLRQVILAALLAVVVAATALALSGIETIGWGISMGLAALVPLAAIVYRRQIMSIFEYVGPTGTLPPARTPPVAAGLAAGAGYALGRRLP